MLKTNASEYDTVPFPKLMIDQSDGMIILVTECSADDELTGTIVHMGSYASNSISSLRLGYHSKRFDTAKFKNFFGTVTIQFNEETK